MWQDADDTVKLWEITRGAVIKDYGKVIPHFNYLIYCLSYFFGTIFWILLFQNFHLRLEETEIIYMQVSFEEKKEELFEMVWSTVIFCVPISSIGTVYINLSIIICFSYDGVLFYDCPAECVSYLSHDQIKVLLTFLFILNFGRSVFLPGSQWIVGLEACPSIWTLPSASLLKCMQLT